MAANSNLTNAKRLKNDEFYTMYEDIEKELIHYEDQIKQHAIYIPCGAAVYCNCDNPSYSNFFEYFCRHAVDLKLKWVAATWYDINDPDKESTFAAMFKYPEELDPDDYDPDDWKDYVNRFEIPGNGDFRSEACIEIMKQADIVVTNPPFSLFREFIMLLEKYNKKYLVIGSMNAIAYKEIFPLIKENKLWIGNGFNLSYVYKTPYANTLNANAKFVTSKGYNPNDGYIKVPGIAWFTNIEHSKRNERMELMKSYTGHENEYPRYDHYPEVIEVNTTKNIPNDYDGIMSVPITWLDKYCPMLFEIIDSNNRYAILDAFNKNEEIRRNHSHGCNINGKPVYSRIFIRRRPEDIERYGNR